MSKPAINIPLKLSTARAQKDAKDFSQTLKSSMLPVLDVWSVATDVIGGMGAALVSAVADARSFQVGIAEISTLVDSSIIKNQDLSRTVLELSAAFGTDTQKQAEGLYQAISSGAAQGIEENRKLLETANKLAVGGVTDIKTAVDGLTSVMNAFGIPVTESTQVMDAFFTTVKNGKTTVGELSGQMGRLASLSKAAGLSIDEMFAGIAALTKVTGNTSLATTQFVGILSSLLKPSAEAVRLNKELGGSWSLAGLRASGLAGVLQDLQLKTNGNAELMAKLIGQTEALSGALALSGNDARLFTEQLDAMSTKAGAGEAAYRKLAEQTTHQMDILSSQLSAMSKQFGESLLRSDAFRASIIALVGWVGDLGKQVSAFTQTETFTYFINTAIRGTARLIDGLAGVAIYSKEVIKILTNPFGTATAEEMMSGLPSALIELAERLRLGLSLQVKQGGPYINPADLLFPPGKPFYEEFKEPAKQIAAAIKQGVQVELNDFWEEFSREALPSPLENALSGIRDYNKGLQEAFDATRLESNLSRQREAIENHAQSMRQSIQSQASAVTGAVSILAGSLGSVIQSAVSGQDNLFERFVSNMLSSVGSMLIGWGTAAIGLGIIGESIPIFGQLLAGAPAIAAGAGAVAAGLAMGGAGALINSGLSDSTGPGSVAATPSFGSVGTRQSSPGQSFTDYLSAPTERASVVNVQVTGFIAGTESGVARQIASMLNKRQSLLPGGA